MGNSLTCDSCGQPIERIAAKLFLAPMKPRVTASDYSTSMDIGECCIVKIRGIGTWRKRKQRRTGNAVGAGQRSAQVKAPRGKARQATGRAKASQ